MAMIMARIISGTVTNIESWPDDQPEAVDLKYIGDKPVSIGDSYRNGKYFRNDEEILTPTEAANKALEKENQALIEALEVAAEELREDNEALDIITKGVDPVDEG